MSIQLPVITNIQDRNEFLELVKSNPGLFIIKLGAEWCGPCKMIENEVNTFISRMPSNVQCAVIDIDKCSDVYAFLKAKRVIVGVPAILVYKKGNVSHIPNDFMIGASKEKLSDLYDRCIQNAITIAHE
jgi:thioredoxin 1